MERTTLFILISTIAALFSCGDKPIAPTNDTPDIDIVSRPCSDTPTVSYAGKTYNTVQIGDQCWLRENLDVGTMIMRNSISDNQTDNSEIEKYCYANDQGNCNTYGGLYQWNEAMQYITTEGAQGLCPTGWHIPTRAEFETLISAVGGNANALKAIGQGTGRNTSGFSALFAGHRDHNNGGSHALGEDTIFWSSSEEGASNAYSIDLYYADANIYSRNYHKNHGYSIRCVKD